MGRYVSRPELASTGAYYRRKKMAMRAHEPASGTLWDRYKRAGDESPHDEHQKRPCHRPPLDRAKYHQSQKQSL